MRSRDKLKTYLYYPNARGHQTGQGSDILQKAPPIRLHDPSRRWSREVTWHIKYLTSSLQRNHEHQTGQGADLSCEASTLKANWSFDHVTNARSRDNLKNLYLHLHKFYGFKLGSGRLLYSGMMFSMQMFKSSPTSCINSMKKIQNGFPLNDTLVQCSQNLNYSGFCEFEKGGSIPAALLSW